jgi:hypothetical protein
MLMLAIMIGGGVPMKDHDNWQQVALTNGRRSGDGLKQRYNEGRWDGAGRELSATGEILAASHEQRAATTPWMVFPGFFWSWTMNPPEPNRKKRTHCSRMESFQHPRP